MLIEQIFDGVGKTHNADSCADNDRDQKQDTLFEFPKQAGDRADEPVLDAERHRHRSAGYARNDVRDADHDPLYDISKKFHDKPPIFLSIFQIQETAKPGSSLPGFSSPIQTCSIIHDIR